MDDSVVIEIEPEQPTERGKRFHMLCQDGDIEKVLLLLPEITKAELNFQYFSDKQPVHGRVSIVARRPPRNLTPFQESLELKNMDLCSLLLDQPNLCPDHNSLKRALNKAASSGNTDIIFKIFNKSSPRDFCEDQIPLIFACRNGFADIVDLFLSANFDKESFDDWKDQNCLMVACDQGHIDIVSRLLESGCNVNAQSRSGKTALMRACAEGFVGVIDRLIAYGADFRHRDKLLNTPLSEACKNGHLEAVDRILNLGADPDVRDENDVSPLEYACLKNYVEIAKLLISFKADVQTVKNKSLTLFPEIKALLDSV